jgi:hypothetical protein
MRAISVALPALTWKSVRNAARAALVYSDILLVMIAASNRESFRIKDFSGLQEGRAQPLPFLPLTSLSLAAPGRARPALGPVSPGGAG